MYGFIVYLHIASVFIFLLGHGVSVHVAFVLRRERNLDRLCALLDLSLFSYLSMMIGLVLFLVTGIIAGIMGSHWGRWWIWTAVVLLVALFVFMSAYGAQYYSRIRIAVGLKPYRRTDQVVPLGPVVSEFEIGALLNSNRPMILLLVGVMGLLVILWLMMFKPF